MKTLGTSYTLEASFQSMFDVRRNIKDLKLLYQYQHVINHTQTCRECVFTLEYFKVCDHE